MTVSKDDIERAVAVLRAGGLIAFPTETVYGLGADAASVEAVKKVFAVKRRPTHHPLIVHVADAVQVANWARDIPPPAQRLARRFWPGPLTIILRRAPRVHDVVTGGQDTIALRVPSHPVGQALLRAFGGGVAAPSANRFGRVSATTAEHVRKEFGNEIELVLDGGESDVGLESTIVDLTGPRPALLRPGWITASQLEQALGCPLALPGTDAARAPGTLPSHYAPQTPLMVMEGDLLGDLAAAFVRRGRRVAVLALSASQPVLQGITWIIAPRDAAGYAHALYANLRGLDEAACDAILVERPPAAPEWAAINDRLNRAATNAESDQP